MSSPNYFQTSIHPFSILKKQADMPRKPKTSATAPIKKPKIWSTDIPTQLHAALSDPAGPSVILIQAPTGFGKTALVATELAQLHVNNPTYQPSCVLMPFRISVKEMHKFASALSPQLKFGYGMRGDTMQTPQDNCRLFTVGYWLEIFLSSLTGAQQDFSQTKPLCVTLDEVHDASWQTDLTLRLLLWAQRRGYPLRIVLASATMNVAEILSSLPDDHLVLSVPQETANVEVHYWPLHCDRFSDKGKFSDEAMMRLKQCLQHILTTSESGDVLVIMPGQEEIDDLLGWFELTYAEESQYLALPLHSQMTREDQSFAIDPAPKGVRKVIISTNIVENAITIAGLSFVIDSCLRKEIHVSTEGISTLKLELAARSNLDQAAGRVGRLGETGHCYRLMHTHEYPMLRPFSPSETHRNPLYFQIIKLIKEGLPLFEVLNHVEKIKVARDCKFLWTHGAIETADASVHFDDVLALLYGRDGKQHQLLKVTKVGEIMAHLHLSLRAGHFLSTAVRVLCNGDLLSSRSSPSSSSTTSSSADEDTEEESTDSSEEEEPDAGLPSDYEQFLPYAACVIAAWMDSKGSMFYLPRKRPNETKDSWVERVDLIRESQQELLSYDCASTLLKIWFSSWCREDASTKGFYAFCKQYGIFDRGLKELGHCVDHTTASLRKLGYDIIEPSVESCAELAEHGSWIMRHLMPSLLRAYSDWIFIENPSGRGRSYRSISEGLHWGYGLRMNYFLDRSVVNDDSEPLGKIVAMSLHQINTSTTALSKIVRIFK